LKTPRLESDFLRLVFLVVLSIGIMLIDQRSDSIRVMRSGLGLLVKPVQDIATVPSLFGEWFSLFSKSRIDLYDEKERLRAQNLELQARLQKLESIENENTRLSELLSASEAVAERVVLAKMVEVSLEPFTHKILINRGREDGVYEGQPVIDTLGVMGQVTHATLFRSAVTLITDPGHAIPVQVRRNGLRAIVYGSGSTGELDIPFIGRQANLRQGDVLVTSGMGGRFPAGYPVAEITEVIKDANEPFLGITAKPIAQLDHSKEVLLIWPEPEPVKQTVIERVVNLDEEDGNRSDGS